MVAAAAAAAAADDAGAAGQSNAAKALGPLPAFAATGTVQGASRSETDQLACTAAWLQRHAAAQQKCGVGWLPGRQTGSPAGWLAGWLVADGL